MPDDLGTVYQQFLKDKFSEFYEVVRTVEVIMDDQCYRVEVVKACHEAQAFYDARYWVLKDVILLPTYPEEGQSKPKPQEMQALVKHEHIWVHRDDPDSALMQALSFLAQGKKK